MLARASLRSLFFVIPLLLLLFFFSFSRFHYSQSPISLLDGVPQSITPDVPEQKPQQPLTVVPTPNAPSPPSKPSSATTPSPYNVSESHIEVFSVSTPDKKYFPIDFGDGTANPNIIPHPSMKNTYIIVAQQHNPTNRSVWFIEYVCLATFKSSPSTVLSCNKSPLILPIAATSSEKCTGDLGYFSMSIGPHDARVFYGPDMPYTIYGSQSKNSCFGQWIQDFRLLLDWGPDPYLKTEFRTPVDIQRPPPFGRIEKNWFLFWDSKGGMYAHYDTWPKRSFARLDMSGSAGPDLGPVAVAKGDQTCLAAYMPKVAPTQESIHQATNSLSITLCARSDPTCKPDATNTFILTIFQYKTYYFFHGVYEPYVMLFRQTAPFQIYSISKKPFWVSGRGEPGSGKNKGNISMEDQIKYNQTEMFYITSISWKEMGMKYHGYLDDVLFVAFGIEDERTAAIDVKAGDLLGELGLCSEVVVESDGVGLQ